MVIDHDSLNVIGVDIHGLNAKLWECHYEKIEND